MNALKRKVNKSPSLALCPMWLRRVIVRLRLSKGDLF